MEDLLLNPITRKQLANVASAKPHALLISGGWGAGKETVADKLVQEILNVKDLINQPYVTKLAPESGSIGIEAVRKLRDFLGRKTTGHNEIRRAVIIIGAGSMTVEAQNALLKSLEEPPDDTIIIMTVDDLTTLQPTIKSRSQQVQILPVSLQAATRYFDHEAPDKVSTAHIISGGNVGLMTALLDQSVDHELKTAIADAKQLLQDSVYNRLVKLEQLAKQKEVLPMLLQGFQRVVMAGLGQATAKNNRPKIKQFIGMARQIDEAQSALDRNGNAKLVLSDLFLSI